MAKEHKRKTRNQNLSIWETIMVFIFGKALTLKQLETRIRDKHPELFYKVSTPKEKREAIKNYYDVIAQERSSTYTKWTFVVISVGGLIALGGYLSQQPTILPNSQFVCPYYQNFNVNTQIVNHTQISTGGYQTISFTFDNIGPSSGYVGFEVTNNSIVTYPSLEPLPHEYGIRSGSNFTTYITEYLYSKENVSPLKYNFSIRVITYDQVVLLPIQTGCFVKTCSYESYYNSSNQNIASKLYFHIIRLHPIIPNRRQTLILFD